MIQNLIYYSRKTDEIETITKISFDYRAINSNYLKISGKKNEDHTFYLKTDQYSGCLYLYYQGLPIMVNPAQ